MPLDPTAAPVPMMLKGPDGVVNEFRAHPLRDIDHEEFNNWCRREYLDRVKQNTSDPELLAVAIQESLSMLWMGTGRVVATTARGMQKLASLLTRQTIAYELINVAGNVTEIMEVFDQLHLRDFGEPSEDDSEGPASGK